MQDNKIQERVFILYAGEDKESENIVHQIAAFMKFLDIKYAEYRDINTMYEKRISDIYNSIENSPKIIFVLSQKYLTNVEYCQKEINKIMLPRVYDKIQDRLHIILTSDLESIHNLTFKDMIKDKARASIDKYIVSELNNQSEDVKNEIQAYKASSDTFIDNLKDYITSGNNFLNMFFAAMKDLEPGNKKKKIYDALHQHKYLLIMVADATNNTYSSLEDLYKSISSDGFNQKLLYTSPESAKLWKNDIEKMNTNKGELTKRELDRESMDERDRELFNKKFLDGEFWKKNRENIDRIVDLGVGTGERTVEIVKSLDLSKKDINIVLVDSSSNMIKESFNHIKTILKDRFFDIDGVHGLDADFMKFAETEKCFVQSDANIDLDNRTAFFILGGTFCNIDLDLFILSLSKVMIEGDYLTIGIHIQDDGIKLDKLRDNIKKTYDFKLLEDMFKSSLSEIKINMSNFGYKFVTYAKKGEAIQFVANLQTTCNRLEGDQKKYLLIESIRYKLSYILDIFEKGFKVKGRNRNMQFKKVELVKTNETAYVTFEYKG